MSDIEFIDGMIIKAPKENAPDFVKAGGSIKRLDMIAWLEKQEGDWINFDVKVAKSGKWYASVDAWKPNSDKAERQEPKPAHADASNGFVDDEIPFAPIPRRAYW